MARRDMFPSRTPEAVKRPAACPFCNGNVIDTLAKEITVTSVWRCRHCDRTWTIASAATPPPRFT